MSKECLQIAMYIIYTQYMIYRYMKYTYSCSTKLGVIRLEQLRQLLATNFQAEM